MLIWLTGALGAKATEKIVIPISTNETDLVLQVGDNGRLYQTYLGHRLSNRSDLKQFNWYNKAASDGSVSQRGWEAYACQGGEDFFEPALALVHADGNRATYLYYKRHEVKDIPGGKETTIYLADNKYPVNVELHYQAYPNENIIRTWTEISHHEKGDIRLDAYASTMLYFNRKDYWLTEFSGDWANRPTCCRSS